MFPSFVSALASQTVIILFVLELLWQESLKETLQNLAMLLTGLTNFCQMIDKNFFLWKTVLAKIVFIRKNSFCHLNLSHCHINFTPDFLLLQWVTLSFGLEYYIEFSINAGYNTQFKQKK